MAVTTRGQARCNPSRSPGEAMRINLPMKAVFSIFLSLAAASLAGCAVKTDVRATGVHQWPPGATTYRILRSPPQEVDPEEDTYEALIRNELMRYGFSDAGRSTDEAHYLISVAHEARPVKVTVQAPAVECGGQQIVCGQPGSADGWMPGGAYLHRLTLRLVDARTGEEVYKVASTTRSGDGHSLHTMRYLLTSAFARFPYDRRDWQVKLRRDDDKTAAQVVSVKSVER